MSTAPQSYLLEIVTWLGNLVRVSLSPAPVTRGVLPSGNLLEGRLPLVMCLNRVSCSSSWLEIMDWKYRHFTQPVFY